MDDIQNDILVRVHQMISSCRDADTTANSTLIDLADQGEQLENIETTLKKIDATLIDTNHNIKRMKGLTQRVIDSFRTRFQRKKLSKLHALIRRKNTSVSTEPIRRREVDFQSTKRNLVKMDSSIDGQIDQAFCEINYLLHNLKEKAYIMNDQLVEQADRLDYIKEQMTDSTDYVQKQYFDIKKVNS